MHIVINHNRRPHIGQSHVETETKIDPGYSDLGSYLAFAGVIFTHGTSKPPISPESIVSITIVK